MMVSRRHRLWVGVVTGCAMAALLATWLVLPRLEGTSHRSGAAKLGEYGERLTRTRSEAEKWNTTVEYWRGVRASDRPGEDGIPGAALVRDPIIADLWLSCCPEIQLHLRMDANDLRDLARSLDSNDLFRWGYTVRENGRSVHVSASCRRTVGETAREWLARVTGVTFKDSVAFEEWYERNGKGGSWDGNVGVWRSGQE